MWYLKPEERLHEWRAFRKHLAGLSFDDAVKQTVNLWSYAPFVNHYLDHIEDKDWPTPWELVAENNYDDIAKAAGMLYTLFLSEHGKNHSFSLIEARGKSGLDTYNLVSIDDGKYILNFAFNEVISNLSLDKELDITKAHTAEALQLDKY
jgi:hypothetical protein